MSAYNDDDATGDEQQRIEEKKRNLELMTLMLMVLMRGDADVISPDGVLMVLMLGSATDKEK